MTSFVSRLRALALPALVLSGLLAAGQAAAAESKCKLQQLAELPVTMVATRPTIKVSINGQEAVFLVDSGAFYSMMARDALSRYGLKERSEAGFKVVGVGGSEDAGSTEVKTFAVGGANLGRREFVITKGMGSGVSGLIGQDILTALDTEFDLANGVIRLFKSENCPSSADLGYWSPGKAQVLTKAGPLSPRDRAIGAYATANGHQIRVVFDTGAFLSGISLRAAARAGVTPASPGVVQTVGSTGFGDKVRRTWVAPFDSFALGGEEIRKTRLRISETELEGIDMLLGADFFLSHRILVSQSQQKIYFTYNGGPVFRLETAVQSAEAAGPPGAPDAAPPAAGPLSDQPKDADGFARRAAASMGRREPGPAIADLDRAIALSPEDGELYLRRAEAHQMNRQPVLAMADLDEGIRRKPDSPEALIHRAQLYFGQRDRARAEADLDAADKLKIDDPSVRLSIAGVYEGAGDYDAAIAEYDRWIHDHPRDGQLPQALNGACWDRAVVKRDLDHALQDCNAAVNMRPGAANILDSRGLVHLDRGEIDQAIADYSAALKIQPKQPLTLYARGVAKQKKGLKEAGDADIQAATALNPKIADQAKRFGIAAADAPSPGG